MTHWRKLSNRELVREHLRPMADAEDLEGRWDEAKAIKEAARRLLLPKSRREKPQERRPYRPRQDK